MTVPWFVYMLRCSDGSLYVGITDDVPARVATHNRAKGPDYTRRRLPVQLIYQEAYPDKSAARTREIELKGRRRGKKLALLRGSPSSAERASSG